MAWTLDKARRLEYLRGIDEPGGRPVTEAEARERSALKVELHIWLWHAHAEERREEFARYDAGCGCPDCEGYRRRFDEMVAEMVAGPGRIGADRGGPGRAGDPPQGGRPG